jgi:murein DD-endopeptidase MepM/ murein hydrolase activator NlpD
MVPVAGVTPSKITDTFNAPRDGGRRRHNALDILAPIGTPVLSADDGVVLALRSNRLGGRVIYAADPSRRFVYYYAHLSRYHPSLGPGQSLRRGEVIGYVGATGNADPRVPHLHFQVMAFPPDNRWWTGTPIDPLPYLASPGRQVRP